ncbi:hypothetical protein [Archangium lipolyticum]|uniref:hypothetical protein n=1 Tax=Archangium lipolyticum TaxID=2970465 RepID=UPI00214A18FF|nr:hypothetical protein [Archangium lipolyticum]
MVGDHPILFRGLDFDKGSGRPMPVQDKRPVLVERTDEDFISAFLGELGSDEGRKLLAGTVRNAGQRVQGLKLYQPVHRSFHLAVFEAACDVFGEPRLDPAKIESTGLVVRRINPQTKKTEGWMKLRGEVHGWVPLEDARELDRDPDPARRGAAFPVGPPQLNALVENALGASPPYEESVSLLFVAPPHVCAAAQRTVLYGLVPVASSEAVSNKAAQPHRYDEQELRELLAPYFSDAVGVELMKELTGKRYSFHYADEINADMEIPAAKRPLAEKQLDQFVAMLRKLISIFNAFDPKEGLLPALNRLRLDYGGTSRPMGTALAEAAEVFVLEHSDKADRNKKTFLMPRSWPRLSKADVADLVRAASSASLNRLQKLLPQRGRFDNADALYEVRGFIRVRRDDGCPPAIVWSTPSPPFEIAPWFENGRLPPVQVALPPVTRKSVRSLLPNVTFQVPRNVFDLLSINKPKDFLEEKAKTGDGDGVDWICGFNIPIITLCAFIVLSIFLALLNIIFWWLPFIKICIPLPRSMPRPPQIRTP